MSNVCRALQEAADKITSLQENIFSKHKEHIAKLSVEIARKVLCQKVEKGDYEIAPIIEEALQSCPTRQNVVAHLNPEDLAKYQKLQQENKSEALVGIEFVADPNVGPAHCILETPKGIIESSVEEYLERICEVLKKAG